MINCFNVMTVVCYIFFTLEICICLTIVLMIAFFIFVSSTWYLVMSFLLIDLVDNSFDIFENGAVSLIPSLKRYFIYHGPRFLMLLETLIPEVLIWLHWKEPNQC